MVSGYRSSVSLFELHQSLTRAGAILWMDDRRRFVPEPTEEDLAAQAAETTGLPDVSAAAPALVEGTVIEELSGDSDGFEDLGKDKDAIQLRQRRAAGAGAAEDAAGMAAEGDAPSAAKDDSKKGQ